MQRTQIYFEEDTIAKLKEISKELKISVSEFIRQVIKKELNNNKKESFSNFLKELEPLESFQDTDATTYVKNLRSKSRLLSE
jgi:flagellar biosynthesis/type III secretory pathway protein FliH